VSNEVLYDYNLDVEFTSYETYVMCSDDFMVVNTAYPQKDNEELRVLIGDAIAQAMEDRGHKTNVFDPQLQAGFMIIIKEPGADPSNCEDQSALQYWENFKLQTEQYDKETLVAYVADFKTNKIIWQASIACRLDRSEYQIKDYIKELVAELFATYPKKVVISETEELQP